MGDWTCRQVSAIPIMQDALLTTSAAFDGVTHGLAQTSRSLLGPRASPPQDELLHHRAKTAPAPRKFTKGFASVPQRLTWLPPCPSRLSHGQNVDLIGLRHTHRWKVKTPAQAPTLEGDTARPNRNIRAGEPLATRSAAHRSPLQNVEAPPSST